MSKYRMFDLPHVWKDDAEHVMSQPVSAAIRKCAAELQEAMPQHTALLEAAKAIMREYRHLMGDQTPEIDDMEAAIKQAEEGEA